MGRARFPTKAPHSIEQQKAAIDLFIEWAGVSRAPSSFTKKDATAFLEVLSSLPKGRGRSKRFQNASIAECVKTAERENLKLLSTLTKNRYISQLSAFFHWLQKRDDDVDNIWIGRSFETNKQPNQRPAFSNSQLQSIVSSPLYAGFLEDGKEQFPGNCQARDWRYWIPLLCMFTGARVTEIAQLYVDDIEEKNGYLVGYSAAGSAS